MGWSTRVARAVIGLFVDDGGFALAILLWVVAVWLGAPHLGPQPPIGGIVLFAGLAMILIGSAWRRARKSS